MSDDRKARFDSALGWHFLRYSRLLGFKDGRLVTPGSTLSTPDPERPISCCEYGMHASRKLKDAVEFAPRWQAGYSFLTYVEVTGEIRRHGKEGYWNDQDQYVSRWREDKIAGRTRRVIYGPFPVQDIFAEVNVTNDSNDGLLEVPESQILDAMKRLHERHHVQKELPE